MKFDSHFFIVKALFPDLNPELLETWQFHKRKSKSQNEVFAMLQELFPKVEVFSNYVVNSNEKRKEQNFKWINDSENVELDILIPALNLAFEYQGMQHYKGSKIHGSDVTIQQKVRKFEKRKLNRHREMLERTKYARKWELHSYKYRIIGKETQRN